MQSVPDGSPSSDPSPTTPISTPDIPTQSNVTGSDPTTVTTVASTVTPPTGAPAESILQRLSDLDAEILQLKTEVAANTAAISANTAGTTDVDIDSFHVDYLALKEDYAVLKWTVEGK
jgi:hypothetical protein